jgi:hypothetical protein
MLEALVLTIGVACGPQSTAPFVSCLRPVHTTPCEVEEVGFQRIEIEGNFAVIVGERTLRIPVEAFGGRDRIWVGAGFSQFSGPGAKPRYVAIRRSRSGRIVSASIHMQAL